VTGSEKFGTVDSYAATVRIRILAEACEQQSLCIDSPQRGFDPYSTDVGALSERVRPRRTLDDMLRLSEATVRNRLRAK
jgi:hypothetical protein